MLGVFYAFLSTIGWGFTYAYNQKLLQSYPFYILMLVESSIMMFASLLLCFFKPTFIQYVQPNITTYSFPWPAFIAAFVTVVSKSLILFSIVNCGASVAASIEIMYPIFVLLFVFLIFQHIPSTAFLLGVLLMMAGAVVIVRTM